MTNVRALQSAPQMGRDLEPEELPTGVQLDTDLANACRLGRIYGDLLRYVHTMGAWHRWVGSHWERDDTCEAERLMVKVTRGLEQRAATLYAHAASLSDETERKRVQVLAARYLRWANKSQSAKLVDSALKLARTLERFSVTPDQLDTDNMLFACANGTIDLRSGALRPANPADLITKSSPVLFDAGATCPTWDAFLRRIFVDSDLIAYMQRACGYSLTARTDEQCLFILWGNGANGKSTFIEAIRFVVGGYGQTTPTTTLMDSQKSEHRNDIARLVGARFVSASESAEGKRFDEELVKRLTGGDTMTARFLRKEFFEFRPVLKPWIATNHKPDVRGVDEGIWRRMHFVPFTVTIPPAEQDHQLASKLQAEAAGILAWAVRGALDWQKEGLRPPAVVTEATREWREESNQVAQFVAECCVTGEHDYARCKSADIYGAYREWARDQGNEALSQTAFGKRLTALGFVQARTSDARMWLGLSLNARPDRRGGGDA